MELSRTIMQIGDKCIWSLGIEGKGLLRTPLVGGDDSHYIYRYIYHASIYGRNYMDTQAVVLKKLNCITV